MTEHYISAQLLVTEDSDGTLTLTILTEPDDSTPEHVAGALDSWLNKSPAGFNLSRLPR